MVKKLLHFQLSMLAATRKAVQFCDILLYIIWSWVALVDEDQWILWIAQQEISWQAQRSGHEVGVSVSASFIELDFRIKILKSVICLLSATGISLPTQKYMTSATYVNNNVKQD